MRMHPMLRRSASIAFTLLIAASTARGQGYLQTNLVSDSSSVVTAEQYDPNLMNPWGVALSTGSPLWVANQVSGVASVYAITGTSVTVNKTLAPGIPNLSSTSPNPAGGPPGPTGQVSTGAAGITVASTDFQVAGGKASFIFGNLDGSISAWKGGLSSAVIEAQVAGASFTGLAIGNSVLTGHQPFIYAADQNSNNVYMFNSSWTQVGSLKDPNLPANSPYTAFNVQNLGGTIFVTYANAGNPLGGFVDEYTTDGTYITRLIDDSVVGPNTHLDTPWGLAIAPAGWGKFGGDLLVGNNDGDGTINAYTLSGVYQGQIQLVGGSLFSEAELWGMTFGNGGSGGSPNILYFVAGLPSQADGLVGALSAVPEPSSVVLGLIGLGLGMASYGWRNRRRPATV